MPRGRPIEPVVLTDDEKDQLLSLANSRSLPHGVVRRAQIVLACAQGEANASIARRMRLSDATVGKWRKRYRMQGIEGLHDELRAGRPRTHDDERVAEVINTALQTKPPDGATHWSVRAMAEQSGVSKSTVQRWFSLFAIQLFPPPALLQALQRPLLRREGARYRRPLSQPARPRRRAVCRRENPGPGAQPHPTDAADGAGLRRRGHPRLRPSRHHHPVRRPRHRHRTGHHPVQEAPSPPGVSRLPTPHRRQRPRTVRRSPHRRKHATTQSCADNYATHKHPKVRAWLARRPRYHIHYTPTYASWLNQVERWFGIITQTAIRRGSFSNVSELVNKIDLFVHHYNAKATPFMWTATADSILAKVQRLCSYISGTQH